ncbi:PAS domain-containing response regulator [Haloarchaeobius amylolyticus]|uniref:PAS domain-containing response regulator n=1 Tax=Haloarchaeobius amylolyticus TaxID=1198296 RepID=UPI00226DB93C|nr:response regulator [Haloarchaeobius amylolyticus]
MPAQDPVPQPSGDGDLVSGRAETSVGTLGPVGDDGRTPTILVVDDQPEMAEATAAYLEREYEDAEVVTATSGDEGRTIIDDREIDCVVSDYDMPGMDGLAFLSVVRERDAGLPFVLFTGKGSEEIASEAISAGVSDYLQKGGIDQLALLANRVKNLIDKRRAEEALRLRVQAIEAAREGIAILDDEGRYVYMNEAYAAMHGYEVAELLGETWEVLSTDEEVAVFSEEIMPELSSVGTWRGSVTGVRSDGSRFPKDLSMAHMDGGGHVCVISDMTDYVAVSEETVAERVLHAHETGAMLVEGESIVGANNEFLTLVRHSRDTLLALTVPALGAGLTRLVERTRETGRTQEGTVTLSAESGTTTTVRCRVAVVDPQRESVAVLAWRA